MTDLPSQPSRARFLLAKCIIVSLVLHCAALYIWVKHPLLLSKYNPLFLVSAQSPIKSGVESKDPSLDEVLEDFFESFFLANSQEPLKSNPLSISDTSALLQGTKLEKTDTDLTLPTCKTHLLQNKTPEASLQTSSPFTEEELNESSLITPTFSLTTPTPLFIQQEATSYQLPHFACESEPLEEDLISFQNNTSPLQEPFSQSRAYHSYSSQAPALSKEPLPSTPVTEAKDLLVTQEALPFSLYEVPASITNKTDPQTLLAESDMSEVDNYLPTQVLYSMQWNDGFSVTPSFFADDDGYIFSLSLASNETVEAEKVKQNFYFLIDISSTVEKHKITVFKRSVIKALSALQSGDNFNIFLLDKKIVRFSQHSVPFSFQNLRKAEEFLGKANDRPIFTSFDLFQGLNQTLDYIDSTDEVHTAILLTNGKISGNLSNNQKAMTRFLDKNQGKMTLCTAAVGKNNDLVHLDMLSSLSGGKLLYSDTNASLPRKLSVFMKSLQEPLAKDVHLSIRTNDPKADIVLLPRASQSPHLYNKEPYVIMGKISRLADLQVSLEGKNEEGWVLVSKEVNFSAAEEATSQVKKEWALRQASILYDRFLHSPDKAYLQDAKEILRMTHGRTLGE